MNEPQTQHAQTTHTHTYKIAGYAINGITRPVSSTLQQPPHPDVPVSQEGGTGERHHLQSLGRALLVCLG
jgi:hypothetical protein